MVVEPCTNLGSVGDLRPTEIGVWGLALLSKPHYSTGKPQKYWSWRLRYANEARLHCVYIKDVNLRN